VVPEVIYITWTTLKVSIDSMVGYVENKHYNQNACHTRGASK